MATTQTKRIELLERQTVVLQDQVLFLQDALKQFIAASTQVVVATAGRLELLERDRAHEPTPAQPAKPKRHLRVVYGKKGMARG
jgi:hypothetical protein